MDLVETPEAFVLRADLPGLSEDDVKIELDDNVLTISGERKAAHEGHKEGYYRVERSWGKFSRSLTLPEGVDPDSVKASFDRGVLEVRIPKPEQRKPRKVAIAVGATPATIDGRRERHRDARAQRLDARSVAERRVLAATTCSPRAILPAVRPSGCPR